MDQATPTQGFGRFIKYIFIAAVISGIVSSVPVLCCANFLFCFLNMGGILLALWLYFNAFPDDTLTTNESMLFGAFAGAGAGMIAGILGMINMVLVPELVHLITRIIGPWKPIDLATAPVEVGIVTAVMIPVWVVLYAGFGLLASSLGMSIFFKSRLRNS